MGELIDRIYSIVSWKGMWQKCLSKQYKDKVLELIFQLLLLLCTTHSPRIVNVVLYIIWNIYENFSVEKKMMLYNLSWILLSTIFSGSLQGMKTSCSHQDGNDLEPWNVHAISHIHPEVENTWYVVSQVSLSLQKENNLKKKILVFGWAENFSAYPCLFQLTCSFSWG